MSNQAIDIPFTQDRFSLAQGQGGLSERSSKTDIFIFVVPGNGEYNSADVRNIIWHWEYKGVGSGKQLIRGMNCFSLRWEDETWKAFKLRFEFDSLAWSKNFG